MFNPQMQQNLVRNREESKKEQREKEENKKNEEKNKPISQPKKSFMQRMIPPSVKANLSQIKKGDAAILIAFGAGGFKDLLDFIGATGIGYFFVIILTILIFIFIGFMIVLAIMSGGGGGLHIPLILSGGTITEILPGIDFLPATMGTVFVIYWTILSKRKKNQQKMEKRSSYA